MFFEEWNEKDLADFIRRDRNHPSVVMWSVGNEVLEQWSNPADTLTFNRPICVEFLSGDQTQLRMNFPLMRSDKEIGGDCQGA